MLASITGKNFDPTQTAAANAIYEAAFPPEERLDRATFVHYLQQPPKGFDMLAIREKPDSPIQGIIGHWALEQSSDSEIDKPAPTLLFLEHLAVDEISRSSGIGALAIQEWLARLREQHNPTSIVVLECDPPKTDEWSERRIEFYKRQGFDIIDTEYVQPPYPGGQPVPLWLMARRLENDSPIPITDDDASHVKDTLVTDVYGQ